MRTGTMTGGLLAVAGTIVALNPLVALIIVAGMAICYALWLLACFILAVKRPRHCITMGLLHIDIRPAPKTNQGIAVQHVNAPHDNGAAKATRDPGRSP